jgi:NADH-quinone oxidoreductase subunit N
MTPAAGAVVSVDLATLLPVLAPAAGAAVVLVADAIAPQLRRTHAAVGLLALLLGAAGVIPGLGSALGDTRESLCLPSAPSVCLYSVGPAASALQLAALLGAVITLLLAWPDEERAPRGRTSVTVALVLTATCGATAVAAARDLGSWLVALELATLPTIALVALRGARSAVSGAVSLLTTSLVSFSLVALSAACWYTATASPLLAPDAALAAAAHPGRRPILVLAVVLAVAGIGFKLSLVPFHAWTPEAYDGAPLPVAAFLAGTSKVAALAALLVVTRAITPLGPPVLTAIAVVAVLSMTLGNVMALRQDGVLRLLAWSTVSQAGWVVLPLATLSAGALEASTAYLLAYVVATLTVFAVVAALVHVRGVTHARRLTAYRGLLRTRPGYAVALGLGLLSLAGLPPGVLGLVAKVVALRPVVAGQLWLLAVVAAGNAVLGVAVYLRWLRLLLERPEPGEAPAAGRRAHPTVVLAVGLGAAALILTSVDPQLLLRLLGG